MTPYSLVMGVPEMLEPYDYLAAGKEARTLDRDEEKLAKKFFKTLDLLSTNPHHNSLNTQEIDALSKRVGFKVFQSYLENRTPGAARLFWAFGPETRADHGSGVGAASREYPAWVRGHPTVAISSLSRASFG